MKDSVSVIIPCYNSEKSIGETIESALSQKKVHAEVLVVNDGSTDKSETEILRFRKHVKYISTSNMGARHARNIGLKESSGNRIQFLDSDDRLGEYCIYNKLSFDCADNEIPVCDVSMTEGGKCTWFWNFPYYDLFTMLRAGSPQTSAPLHYREDLITVGGFRENLPCSQEYDLHLRIAAINGKCMVSNQSADVTITATPGSISRSKGTIMQEVVREVLLSLEACIKKEDIDEYHRAVSQHLTWCGQLIWRFGNADLGEKFFLDAEKLSSDNVDYSRYKLIEKYFIKLLGVRSFERFRASLRPYLKVQS